MDESIDRINWSINTFYNLIDPLDVGTSFKHKFCERYKPISVRVARIIDGFNLEVLMTGTDNFIRHKHSHCSNARQGSFWMWSIITGMDILYCLIISLKVGSQAEHTISDGTKAIKVLVDRDKDGFNMSAVTIDSEELINQEYFSSSLDGASQCVIWSAAVLDCFEG